MTFYNLSTYWQKLESISSRLEMTAVLAELFSQLEKSEVKPASYLLQGSLVPAYESLEFQLSVKMVVRALDRLKLDNEVMRLYKQHGDLGLVAEIVRAQIEPSQPTHLPSLLQVYDRLVAIAREVGTGSQERKLLLLQQLLLDLDPISAKFVARIIIGKLRLGFSVMTLLDALSWAKTGTKEHRGLLEEAYQKKADIGALAEVYLSSVNGQSASQVLQDYQAQVGVPIVPALCQRLNSSREIIEKMGQVVVEPKLDGLRTQIHIIKEDDGGDDQADGKADVKAGSTQLKKLAIFTRNLEDISHMFPELMQVAQSINCKECVLDAEVIGYDPKTGALLPFQETVTRKRKHGIEAASQQVPVRFYVFDLLVQEGESLLALPFAERRRRLREVVPQDDELIRLTTITETSDPAVVQELHEGFLAEGLEGAVVKKADSIYQSGRKGWSWVKIKEAEGTTGKLADTLDVVVMGYYAGRGKRTAFGVGAFLVGVLADDILEDGQRSDQIKTLAKIGTGLTDEQFRELKERCDKLAIPKQPQNYQVAKSLLPDVWIQPGLVVEVAADELTRSPVHTAGLALRFPRLVKFRDDKGWQEATRSSELAQIAG
jgi:DNA ligase 1